jgi:hypothetical protein
MPVTEMDKDSSVGMKSRLRLIRYAVVALVVMAVNVVSAGGAQASIINSPGYHHFAEGDTGLCLTLDADTATMVGWRCLNAASEEWGFVSVIPRAGSPTYYMFVNHWTDQCMAVPGVPVNGTPVVEVPCNPLDVRQAWYMKQICDSTICYHVSSYTGALCLDKPEGDGTDGVRLQMWNCAAEDVSLPFADRHDEQIWRYR